MSSSSSSLSDGSGQTESFTSSYDSGKTGGSVFSQMRAMLRRTILIRMRNPKRVCFQILYPILLMGGLIAFALTSQSSRQWDLIDDYPSVQLGPPLALPLSVIAVAPDDSDTLAFVRAAVARSDLFELILGPSLPKNTFVVRGFASNEDLEKNADRQGLWAGVVFPPGGVRAQLDRFNTAVRNVSSGPKFEYRLRFNSTLLPPRPLFNTRPGDCRGKFDESVATESGSFQGSKMPERSSCAADSYVFMNECTLQLALALEFAERVDSSRSVPYKQAGVMAAFLNSTLPGSGGAILSNSTNLNVSFSVQQMPTDERFVREQSDILGAIVPVYFVFSFFPAVTGIANSITEEKEKKRRVYFQILGIREAVFWSSWAIVDFVQLSLAAILVVAVVVPTELVPQVEFGVLLLLTLMFCAALTGFAYTLSTFFSKAKSASFGSMLAVIAMSAAFYVIDLMPLPVKYIFAMLPSIPVSLGIQYIITQAEFGGVVSFENASDSSTGDQFTLTASFCMLAVDMVLYFFLAWYLGQVIPSELGVSKPWNFLFRRLAPVAHREVRDTSANSDTQSDEDLYSRSSLSTAEGEVFDGLEITKLTKLFPGKRARHCSKQGCYSENEEDTVAVDHVSLRARRGEIIGLLGHNGAGKSTLLSMLVGLHGPSSGDAALFGLSILDQVSLDQIRPATGYVPQDNDILQDEMKVMEHMEFVCGVKDISNRESMGVLTSVGLSEADTNKFARQLSGGQKRKLCLAMALVGNPRLLILDEHTAGVDVVARRSLRGVVKGDRNDRVTLIASHLLDEVEALCDEVLLLDRGNVHSRGTILGLKTQFGISYSLTVTAPRKYHADFHRAVVQEVAAAELLSSLGDEIKFALPISATRKFPALFENLEGNLRLKQLQLALPTLDQVFMKLEEEKEDFMRSESTASDSYFSDTSESSFEFESSHSSEGGDSEKAGDYRQPSFRSEFFALFKAGLVIRMRTPAYFVCQLIFPALFILVAFIIISVTDNSLVVNLGTSSDTLEVNSSFASLAKALKDADVEVERGISTGWRTGPGAAGWGNDLASVFPTSIVLGDLNDGADGFNPGIPSSFDIAQTASRLRTEALGGATQYSADALVSVVLHTNFTYVHEVPSAISRFSTALLRFLTDLPSASVEFSLQSFSVDLLPFDVGSMIAGIFICLAFGSAGVMGAILPVKLREDGVDHRLRLAGMRRVPFWLSIFAADIVAPLLVCLITVILVPIFRVPAFDGPALLIFSLGIALFCPLVVLHAYVWSFAFSSSETVGQVFTGVYGQFLQIPYLILFFAYSFVSRDDIGYVLIVNLVVLAVVPLSGLGSLLATLLRFHAETVFGFRRNETVDVGSYFSPDAHIIYALFAMLFHTALSIVLMIHLDREAVRHRRQTRKMRHAFQRASVLAGKNAAEKDDDDRDVEAERVRVAKLVRKDFKSDYDRSRNEILIHDLSVVFPGGDANSIKVAVHHVSLAVERGNRVALLGPNGAGKTSLFGAITAATPIAAGKAEIHGHDIGTDSASAFRSVGFTAQGNQLVEQWTAREHIELFGLLHGLTRASFADELAARVGISEHLEKRASELSGGTQRKLSLAIATLGAPAAQIFDEPSTGVDVYAQQQLWEEIRVNSRDAAAIISTHSMSEASALCNIVVIMIAGHIRAIGTPEHLLSLYGSGYILEVQCGGEGDDGDFMSFIRTLFPDAQMLDSFGGRSRFHVLTREPHFSDAGRLLRMAGKRRLPAHPFHDDSSELDDRPSVLRAARLSRKERRALRPSFATVFSALDGARVLYDIVDFSFSQPTLEQIFFHFVQGQEEEEGKVDERE